MQITIDLSKTSRDDADKAIAAIVAYYCIAPVRAGLSLIECDLASKSDVSVEHPKPQEAAAPSIVVATTSPIVPEAAQVFSPPTMFVPTPPASAVDVDTEGLPWDGRIHTATKTKTQAGVWKKRKGATDVDEVKRELLGVMQLPLPLSAITAVGEGQQDTPLPPAPPSTTTGPTTLVQLMPLVTKAMLANTIPSSALLEVTTALGLPSIPSLAQRPDMVARVWEMLVAQHPVLGAA